jgi:hypothetical protein
VRRLRSPPTGKPSATPCAQPDCHRPQRPAGCQLSRPSDCGVQRHAEQLQLDGLRERQQPVRGRSPVAEVQTYSVSATNPGGAGAPASASADWRSSPTSPPGFCGQFPSFLFTDEGWTGTRLVSRDFTDDPGFAWDGVWVVKLAVPPRAASTQLGRISVAEFGGPPTARQTTLSRFPWDFRPDDPTGNNGPLAQRSGNTTAILFGLGASSGGVQGLTPGEVYYVNVRNWQVETGSISCDPSMVAAMLS